MAVRQAIPGFGDQPLLALGGSVDEVAFHWAIWARDRIWAG